MEGAHLCAKCWRETSFIDGAKCDCCGAPLSGFDEELILTCDSCLSHPPAWNKGRAAVLYEGAGRRVVLALKHGDRLDMAKPLAGWLTRAGQDLIAKADIVAPVPLHWQRLVKRRYNQSFELVRGLGQSDEFQAAPNLVKRVRKTVPQEGMNREERFENQRGAFAVSDMHTLAGKNILLIDDVMTTGATLSSCAEALYDKGADQVNVLVLARVARSE